MIQLTEVSKTYIPHTLFENVTLQIHEKSRLGLIGRNGCGKSTLLKMIMGLVDPDEGTLYRAPGTSVNYLSQEPMLSAVNTLESELTSVFREINALLAEEKELLNTLEKQTDEKTVKRLAQVHEDLHRLDAVSVEPKVHRMASGLGFSQADLARNVMEFSGGWKMRINLAKVLLEGADILLLDEPTNHLDPDACEWLEGFLEEYPGGLVVVSHDRRFLDRVCNQIAEVDSGRLTLYPGNYSAYLVQKQERLERNQSSYERQQKEIAKQTAYIERFRASANRSTQAKSREKQLARVERIELMETDTRRMAVRFPSPVASGKQVVTVRNVTKAFGPKTLFSNANADVQRYQRIFLLGPNGCGKTTLFRLILDQIAPDAGELRFGHQVVPGYFAQNQLETLDASLSVFDTIHNACPKLTNTEVRGLLARFLFTGDEVFKPVSVLSGGEKSKLALAKLILSGPNLLLLDEPTNHMDIPAKEVLEDAFREYDGTVLCISHDRYFIEQLATHVWEIYEGHLIQYEGGYDYYLQKREEFRVRALTNGSQSASRSVIDSTASPSDTESLKPSGSSSPMKARKELEKQLNKLEKSIMALEEELLTLQSRLTELSVEQNYEALAAVNQDIESRQAQLDVLNQNWEEVAEALSDA